VEAGARYQRAESDATGRGGDGGEQRPRFPRPPRAIDLIAVEQVITKPDRIEAHLLAEARHRHDVRPANLALDLRQLEADFERARGR